MPENSLFFLTLQPKLSMAKCRRNVENFLDACKKLGVSQVIVFFPNKIII